MLLPVPSKDDPTWRIKRWSNPERAKVVAGTPKSLQVTCKPREQGMESGSGFFAVPKGFPCSAATITYEVFVPEDFTWVKGGKFGFGFGLGNELETASGGDWKQDCGSVRTMWRDKGQTIAYLYLPLEGRSRDKVIRSQSKAVQEACDGSVGKDTGINVWYKEEKVLKLKKGEWNSVTVQVKLNTPGASDGVLALTVNGETRTLKDMRFREKKNILLNGVLFHTFFGGSTLEWACDSPQTLLFRNVSLV